VFSPLKPASFELSRGQRLLAAGGHVLRCTCVASSTLYGQTMRSARLLRMYVMPVTAGGPRATAWPVPASWLTPRAGPHPQAVENLKAIESRLSTRVF